MDRRINRDSYLSYAKNINEKEQGLILEFTDWLPEEMIDCHAHCNLPSHVRSISEHVFRHMMSSFPSFTLKESKAWHKIIFPGKTIRSLRFANAFYGINHRSANTYLVINSPIEDRVALYGLPDDIQYTILKLRDPRISALKMYYAYFDPPAKEIYQYFPKPVLEEAQHLGIPIILHPPSRVTLCLDQIINLVNDFPSLKICLAHLSLTKSVIPGLEEAFTVLAGYPQIYFDTALIPCAELIKMALQLIGRDRLMYGSDSPLDLIRSVPYQHPILGERLATEYPYHWVDQEERNSYGHLAKNATHACWPALLAIKNKNKQVPYKNIKTEPNINSSKIVEYLCRNF